MAYDRETKAQALALLTEGRNTEQVGRELNLSPDTVRIWAKRFLAVDPAVDAPRVVQEYYRLHHRYAELQHTALDEIEESGEPVKSHLTQLQVGGGISADKIFKAREVSQPQNLTQVLVVLNCEKPEDVLQKAQEYIEGEVKDA